MRERVGAIIIENGKLLVIKRVKTNETYWCFAGGGVEDQENHADALIRECKEELGLDVEVGGLFYKSSFLRQDGEKQEEYFYKCKIIGGELGTGDGPEFQENSNYDGLHEIEWINLKDLENYDLRPEELKKSLM